MSFVVRTTSQLSLYLQFYNENAERTMILCKFHLRIGATKHTNQNTPGSQAINGLTEKGQKIRRKQAV